MPSSTTEAQEITRLIEQGASIDFIKHSRNYSSSQWYNYSAKAYSLNLVEEKKKRKEDEKKAHVLTTPNSDITSIISLNELLANYALALSIFVTKGEFLEVKKLSGDLPYSEAKIVEVIGSITMAPRERILQRRGRFEQLNYFKTFAKLIDAAVLSYYRGNFISCYLTLVPVVEGILIRWMGYIEQDPKPEFEELRKFFKNSHIRQPSPYNIHFHQIFAKACDKILNEHFYRPTTAGASHGNFNRHLASHLLSNNQFATKENCIRLFILLDMMTEIYVYESRSDDARWLISSEQITSDFFIFHNAMSENNSGSPERDILGDQS
jgi:hypothetical protein